MPRAGICIGDGTWGGHVIEYNDAFDLPDDVKQLGEDAIEGFKDQG